MNDDHFRLVKIQREVAWHVFVVVEAQVTARVERNVEEGRRA